MGDLNSMWNIQDRLDDVLYGMAEVEAQNAMYAQNPISAGPSASARSGRGR